MVRLIICVLLLVLACLAVTLDKTYYKVSLKELKRRARAGDRRAKQLYRAAAYDTTLQLLLWFIIVASVAVSIVLLTGIVAGWLAAIVGILIIWLAFLWLPHNRVSDLAERLTLMLTRCWFGYCIICIQPVAGLKNCLSFQNFIYRHLQQRRFAGTAGLAERTAG